MADKGQGDSLQGTTSPPPCANGCGFFGSASTMNMCSKCFRECQKSTSSPAAPPSPSSAELSSLVNLSDDVTKRPVVAVNVADRGNNPTAAARPDCPDVVATPEQTHRPLDAPPPKKIQKNTSRCFSCRKKVGLTGFKCRCGYVFCSTHRYSDQHECDFDYQGYGRQQLAKANPVVIASKLDKI